MSDLSAHSRPLPLTTAFGAGGLLLAEGLAISLTFKHVIDFDCRAVWPGAVCGATSGVAVALACMAGTLVLFALLVPAALRDLVAPSRRGAGQRFWPLALNFAGFALALLPAPLLNGASGAGTVTPALMLWGAGLGLMLTGAALWLAPVPHWRTFALTHGARLAPMALAGLAAPWLATQIRPLWRLDGVADVTFSAVDVLIRLAGYEVQTDPAKKIIGTEAFSINIAPVCSGIEGIALVTIFVTLYLALFRQELRFPRAFLLYPAGILVSFALNIVRVTGLLAIGLSGQPDLAVGGFHSHAGWLMFTLVALGVVLAARHLDWFNRRPALPAGPASARVSPTSLEPGPLSADPIAARLLPFAIFMLSALLASTFSQTPGMVYPLRAAAMAGVLLFFWPALSRIDWRPDLLAPVLGAGVGVMWVLVPVPADATAPYGTLAGGWLWGWYLLRGIGTILLVPVIEELFFRDYLERRLRIGSGPVWRIGAALVTAGLFAALHDRWIEAFLAGLVFSYALARRGKVADAIAAHAMANAVVYGVALASGRLEII